MFRIVMGLLFTSEGLATLFGILGREASPLGEWPFWYAGAIELVGGVLVLLGLATRGASFICSGIMAFAYFTEHQSSGLFPLQNGGLSPALFCWGFLILTFFGPGSLSLSGLFRGRGFAGGSTAGQ
ncbi:DoxX family protein [Streptomyces sp. NPDC029554]|uniref:DoxX family protein n=1 Tax=Streptomyces sp. NPDC029554 TaxID=3155126 RepID=UPI003403F8E5